MLERAEGDLLQADVDALVNTVNTVGVMGKGIALQFKRTYPAMFEEYRKACAAGQVSVGRMHVWATGALTGPRYIVNVPTKKHWRAPSKVEYIDAGLEDLVRVIGELGIESIAVPPLGAGNGGLDWGHVRPRIAAALNVLDGVRVVVFEPVGPPPAREMAPAAREPLTRGRAALVMMLRDYTQVAFEASLVEVQKLMYFLQEAGEPLNLNYQHARYGPYADGLRHVLNRLEGTYLSGYGDASTPVLEAEPITLLDGAVEAAEAALADAPETQARITRVMDVAAGFESMYGMELLATVHWAATREVEDPADTEAVASRVQSWSRRKKDLFTRPHIDAALTHLRGEGWLPAPQEDQAIAA
jgi:O-acetyl-ADP-ribose deacetylase (regulator of RNase III)